MIDPANTAEPEVFKIDPTLALSLPLVSGLSTTEAKFPSKSVNSYATVASSKSTGNEIDPVGPVIETVSVASEVAAPAPLAVTVMV